MKRRLRLDEKAHNGQYETEIGVNHSSSVPAKLEKIKFVIEYIADATPAEISALKKELKRKNFSTDDWIASKTAQAAAVVSGQ